MNGGRKFRSWSDVGEAMAVLESSFLVNIPCGGLDAGSAVAMPFQH